MRTEDKGKATSHDQSDLLGMKPFASIGEDRSAEETKSVVNKLKKNALRAKGSTSATGEKANAGDITSTIGNFVNR